MGRARWGKKKGGRSNSTQKEGEEDRENKRQRVDQRDNTGYVNEEQKHNQAFEEYYAKNDIVPAGEWEQFLDALRRPLPVTFRINGSGRFADHLRDKLQSDFFSHFGGEVKLEVDGEPVESPKPLPWYPDNYAWQMNFSRGQLRKIELLGAIHEFMKKANDNGSISRQEAVSMVPPLFLDVQPSHRVLDMCAAPGSKTFQLLEALHASAPSSDAASAVDLAMGTPSGYVVANDADFQRCSLLTHQTKRVCSPCLMVTNHNAEQFPQLKRDGKPLRFHRVLCDVPCSGDGTIRKSPDIWRRWTVNNGNGLHLMQLRIAMQGVKLLEVGGRLVYSTCTFNPIEDEAVVAEVLMRCGGTMELVDVSSTLPLLKRMEGKRTWHVRDRQTWLESFEDAQAKGIFVEPSLFPSPEKAQLPLHRCMRFLPHHQDTGGFFVAVLQKVSELPPNVEAPVGIQNRAKKAAKATAKKGGHDQDHQGDQTAALDVTAAQPSTDKPSTTPAAPPSDAAGQEPSAPAGEDTPAEAVAPAADQKSSDATAPGNQAGAPANTGDHTEGVPAGDVDGGAAASAGQGGGDAAADPSATEPSWVRGQGSRGRTAGGKHAGMDPIVPVESPEILKGLCDYYGIAPDSPLLTLLLSRSLEKARPKRLSVVSASVMELLKADVKEQLKIIATGLKVFDRQELKEPLTATSCTYRISQEGVPFLLPHVTRQRVQLGLEDFLGLLQDRYISIIPPQTTDAPSADTANNAEAGPQQEQDSIEAAAQPRDPTPWFVGKGKSQRKEETKDTQLLAALHAALPGCVVAELKTEDATQLGLASSQDQAATGALAVNAPLVLSAWKGKATLAIMADKAETMQMMDKIEAARSRLAGKVNV